MPTLTKIFALTFALAFATVVATSPVPVSTTEPETQAQTVNVLHRLAPAILPQRRRR